MEMAKKNECTKKHQKKNTLTGIKPFQLVKALIILFSMLFYCCHSQSTPAVTTVDPGLTQNIFRRLNVRLSGCESISASGLISDAHGAWCLFQCLSSSDCHGFTYNPYQDICGLCLGPQVSNISFLGERTFLKRNITIHNLHLDGESTRSIQQLKSGMVIYLSFTAVGGYNVAFYLEKQKGFGSYDVALKLSPDVATLSNKMWITHQLSGQKWDFGKNVTLSYNTFKVGVKSSIYVMVKSDKFLIMIDTDHYFEYPHFVPFNEITDVKVSGNLLVHELSF